MKWIKYFWTGFEDVATTVVAICAAIVVFVLPFAAILLMSLRAIAGKLIVDGQFQAIPEVIILVIYGIVACVIHGRHIEDPYSH